MGGFFTKVLDRLVGKQDKKLVMVGLDGAGKTTAVYRMNLGQVVTTIPTVGFNVERVNYENIMFTVWDIGGQQQIRKLWRHYYLGMQGAIFVVDSSDRNRIEEAREELFELVKEEQMRSAALLVLANKQDLPDAMDASEIAAKLGLSELKNTHWFIQPTRATTGEGLCAGLDWLSKTLSERHCLTYSHLRS